MSRQMEVIETKRLIIRPLVMSDLLLVHQILDLELKDSNFGTEGSQTLTERERWLQWTILNYEQLSKLNQPPFGERAIVLKETMKLIGICGFVPCLDFFEQLCDFDQIEIQTKQCLATTAFGLFYAIATSFQGCGFATEASKAMTTYAFEQLQVKSVIATTTYNNVASINVMRNLGMQLKRNPISTPSWLQVVGILNHPNNSLLEHQQISK